MSSREWRNIKITIEYDGTDYRGWQRQASGPTIQQRIEEAIARTVGERVKLHGAGRTDAGVHALAQVANFKTRATISTDSLVEALNARLPADIVVTGAEEAPASFHARYDATAKTYRYTIRNSRVPAALERNRVYLVRRRLMARRMQRAAARLAGRHDFRAFAGAGSPRSDYVRNITRISVARTGDTIHITVTADGFLYNMVRAIVGTLVQVGLGKLTPDDVEEILRSRDRRRAGPTAPARGLCLVEVAYGRRTAR